VAELAAEFQQPSINFWHLVATEDLPDFIRNALEGGPKMEARP